jgi:hypothetical protein
VVVPVLDQQAVTKQAGNRISFHSPKQIIPRCHVNESIRLGPHQDYRVESRQRQAENIPHGFVHRLQNRKDIPLP